MLQQATVRDLRAAIKPQLVRPPPGPDLYLPPQFREGGYLYDSREGKPDEEVAVVAESVGSGEIGANEGMEADSQQTEQSDDMVGATRWQKAARKKMIAEQKKAAGVAQKPMIPRLSKGSEKAPGNTPSISEESQISRAARRKKIREEILLAGEGEGFKGYRRRMW